MPSHQIKVQLDPLPWVATQWYRLLLHSYGARPTMHCHWGWLSSFGQIANLKGPYFYPLLSVCVSLTGTSTLQREPILTKLGRKDPTLIQFGRDHNGPDRPRGTAQRLFENLKKFSKITEFKFHNSGPSFFASLSPVYCKKI